MSGMQQDPRSHLKTVFHERYDEIVLLRDIEFHSLCEHHLLPFTGRAHLAYLPDGKIVGLSKLARLVDGYARRPQVQERLTTQIADALMEELRPAVRWSRAPCAESSRKTPPAGLKFSP
jgi:GTP cyclohydrolase I